jgi:hypothetical protein
MQPRAQRQWIQRQLPPAIAGLAKASAMEAPRKAGDALLRVDATPICARRFSVFWGWSLNGHRRGLLVTRRTLAPRVAGCETTAPFVIPVRVGSLEMTCSRGTPVKAWQNRGVPRVARRQLQGSKISQRCPATVADLRAETGRSGCICGRQRTRVTRFWPLTLQTRQRIHPTAIAGVGRRARP